MKKISALVLAGVLLCAPAMALAQPPPSGGRQTSPSPSKTDGFVPVDAPTNPADTIPAPRLVGIAYGFIWLVLFGYLWSVRSRLAHVEREMAAVSQRVSAPRK